MRDEAPSKPSPLAIAFETHQEAISLLSDGLSDLERRLEVVLSHEEKGQDSSASIARGSSPLVKSVAEMTDRLLVLRDRVLLLAERVEL